ncbi:unnamed protein product [Adineta steineri]|uniref:Uncharacterized protein n=1 Tax=Adineta steineri TaxID=433720 RepID=A0A815MJH0_9BILA|nr:unnamed protein product [Adineta steineri]CAF1422412.1 unnamed protein product [Adineta steineri]
MSALEIDALDTYLNGDNQESLLDPTELDQFYAFLTAYPNIDDDDTNTSAIDDDDNDTISIAEDEPIIIENHNGLIIIENHRGLLIVDNNRRALIINHDSDVLTSNHRQ